MTRLKPPPSFPAAHRAAPGPEPIEIVIQLLAAVLESHAQPVARESQSRPMLTVAQTAALLGTSRSTVIRKADAGELPCVVVSHGARKKMRRFPQALIEVLAFHAGGGAQTDLGQYAAAWLQSVASHPQSQDPRP